MGDQECDGLVAEVLDPEIGQWVIRDVRLGLEIELAKLQPLRSKPRTS